MRQFVLNVTEDKGEGTLGNCLELVLVQLDVRYRQIDRDYFPVNFVVFRWIGNTPLASRQHMLTQREVLPLASTGAHTALRSIACTLLGLERGQYLVVPSTFEAGCECPFHMVVHSGTSKPELVELE